MKMVLFDMDGTLTPARGKMSRALCLTLKKIQDSGFKVGIVSGSDIKYIKEQCGIMFDIGGIDPELLTIYPCNGTKCYIVDKKCDTKLQYDFDFKDKVGNKVFASLVYSCLGLLSKLSDESWGLDIPLTGNFIDYRGSMVNFCPIGRNASKLDRKAWASLEAKHNIRKKLISKLKNDFSKHSIAFKLGGDTSIDIFPKGWDKTFVLRNFQDNDEIWFFGDRCQEHGNDKELYDAIKLRNAGGSFETTGPSKTIELVNNNILINL